jgi:hypothetical protein
VIFPHFVVRTPILPKRDLNHRSRSAGYEIDDQSLSLDDSIALAAYLHIHGLNHARVTLLDQ